MRQETLSKGLLLLTAAFPGVDFKAELYWGMLKHLNDESFYIAVMEFIKTRKEIYPGTGPVAILLEMTNEIYKRKLEKRNSLKISDERSDPPPKDWGEMKAKIGRSV